MADNKYLISLGIGSPKSIARFITFGLLDVQTAPDGRMFTPAYESRTFTPEFDERTFVVAYDNRTFTVESD